MGKKRKASGRAAYNGPSREPLAMDSKLRVNTFEDVADSEDEFHINRDKILLEEGPAQKRQRKAREEDEYLDFSDEEVLPASPSIDESEESGEDDYGGATNLFQDPIKLRKPTKTAPGDSDSDSSRAPSEDEDAGGWGTSRKDYYDADVVQTEADALEEEAEARRLQQKYLQGMTEADFGFDEAEWLDAGKEGAESQEDNQEETMGVVSEVLPQQEITDAMGPEERLKILRTRYPEFEPLAKEFLELQSLHEDLCFSAAAASAQQNTLTSTGITSQDKLPIAVLKHTALSAYLAALCMYFTLLTSNATNSESKAVAMSPNELRDHPIMDSLVQFRELWGKIKNLVTPEPVPVHATPRETQNTVESNETHVPKDTEVSPTESKPRKRKSKAERAAAVAQEEANARRLKRVQDTEASLASLSELTKMTSKPTMVPRETLGNEDDSDFGDPAHLTAHEAAQKAARKKSLKFYTSQIAGKLEKRGAAGRDAGGDADLPYKERSRDRQERLNAQAEKRGKMSQPSKEEALGGESDEEDAQAARELRDDGDEDYYDLVASKAHAKKAAKAELAAERAAAAEGIIRVPEDGMEGDDGKRAISYAIEKNKGLHAKRRKEVRNPRVKKRKKFEEKKKRLGSVRQIYRGGEGKGYQGELTGIKGNLIRSVKL